MSDGVLGPAWLASRAARGPGRLVVIAGIGIAMIALVIGVSMRTVEVPPESKVAKMPLINPLPGGLNSNPAQDALLLRAAQDKAREAEQKGQSFTPPMPASVPLRDRLVVKEEPVILGLQEDKILAAPAPKIIVKPIPAPVRVAPEPAPRQEPALRREARPEPAPEARIEKIAATGPAEMTPETKLALDRLFKGWEGQAPFTDIVLTPGDGGLGEGYGASQGGDLRQDSADRPAAIPVSPPPFEKGPARGVAEKVLVSAGRGIFAHTVVAVNSDAGGPIVIEADSGPLAGDRMIGTFAKSTKDRLVVRVTQVEHRGRTIDVTGLVIAPDTMETSVASSVDGHYVERFVMPAAAAFIEGIGHAIIASKSTTVVTPFGGAVTTLNGGLNLQQQLGVAGATAASAVGSILQKETPKVPTIHLAANVTVGVMFLKDVTVPAVPSGSY